MSDSIRKYIVVSEFWFFNEYTKKHEMVAKKSKWCIKQHYELPDKVLLFSMDHPYNYIVVSERLFSMCFKLIQE